MVQRTYRIVRNFNVSKNLKFRFFGNPLLNTPAVTVAKFSGGTRSSSTTGIAGGGRYSGSGGSFDGPSAACRGDVGIDRRGLCDLRMSERNGGIAGAAGLDAARAEPSASVFGGRAILKVRLLDCLWV